MTFNEKQKKLLLSFLSCLSSSFFHPFFCFIIVLLIACSCQNSEYNSIIEKTTNTTIFTGNAMTIRYKVIVGQVLTQDQTDIIQNIVANTFQEVNSIYNKWNPDSEISYLNTLKAHDTVALSPKLERFLKETDVVVKLSGQRFDPTIEPLQKLWKERLQQNQIPSVEELKRIAPAIGWDKIHFSNGKFSKDDERTQIDLSGIAKGLCIDLIAERIAEAGYKNVFVEWGGEICALGQHPDNRPWAVYISRLGDDDPVNAIDTVQLKDQAIATSGDYLQNWTAKEIMNEGSNKSKLAEVTYFHIFDPHTLQPLKSTHHSIASVSVVAPTCALADALATTAMLFPTAEEAKAWSEKVRLEYPSISFWIVTRKGLEKN